jgi:hypothetical protein
MFLDIVFIIVLVFVVEYFLMNWIITNSPNKITYSLNKIYLSTITALMFGFVYMLLVDFKQGNLTDCNYYIGLGIGICILVYAYRNQIGITDFDWANSMIELRSNSIMLSKKMSEQNPFNQNQTKCVEFANYIVRTDQEQITLLEQIVSNSNTKGIFY